MNRPTQLQRSRLLAGGAGALATAPVPARFARHPGGHEEKPPT